MMPLFLDDWDSVGLPPVVYSMDIVDRAYDPTLSANKYVFIAVGDEEKKEEEFYDIWQDVENAKT